MKLSILIIFALFFCSTLSSTIPFSRLFMQTHEPHATKAKTFYWGLGGNTTFYIDSVNPAKSEVSVSVYETDTQRLSADNEAFLANYVELTRVDNFVALTFKAEQIALSVYPPKHCGMFLDLEDTIDMDIPVDLKTQITDLKVMFNIVYDLQYKEYIMDAYNALEAVCEAKTALMEVTE